MKRTSIFMTEEQEQSLHAYARRHGKPVASVVREAVAAYILDDVGAGQLPSFAGAFDSGHSDTAERHDELLFKGLTPHDEGPAARRTPSSRRAAKPVATRARRR